MLRGQVERLKKHNETLDKNDLELKEAKRAAAESLAAVEKTQALWNNKLYNARHDGEVAGKEDAERIARYEKRIADNAAKMAALEREAATLKAAAGKPAHAAAPSPAPAAAARVANEALPALLERLGLSAYRATLQDEDLDVALLSSMGRTELCSNMADLGMAPGEVTRLADALFPPEVS